MSEFNQEMFLSWLDKQNDHPSGMELQKEWPNFPFDELNGCTGPVIDGEFCYYTWDLRDIANGKQPLD